MARNLVPREDKQEALGRPDKMWNTSYFKDIIVPAGGLTTTIAEIVAARSGKTDLPTKINEIVNTASGLDTRLTASEAILTSLQVTQLTGLIGFNTLADMNADLNHAANIVAFVSSDGLADNNGYYIKVGASGSGSWQKSAYVQPVADNGVTNRKIAAEAVMLRNINSDVFSFCGSRVYAGGNPVYVGMVFDLQSYTLSTSDKFKVEYDFYTEDVNALNIGSVVFLNNSSDPSVYTGGLILSLQYTSPVESGRVYHYSVERENYSGSYKYAHIFMLVNTSVNQLTEFYVKDFTFKIGSQQIAPITSLGLHATAGTGDTIESVTNIPINIVPQSDLNPIKVVTTDYASRITEFNGYKTTTKPTSAAYPVYIEMVFDLQPYTTLNTSDKFKVEYGFYAEDNVQSIGSRIFLNDDARVGYPLGGIVYSVDMSAAYVSNAIKTYSQERENYSTTHRYAHIFITPYFVDGSILTALFFRNLKLFVGSTEIAPITDYLVYNAPVTSPVVVADYLDKALLLQKDFQLQVNDKIINKWYDKRVDIIGDSITYGAVWDSETSSFITTDKQYHYWLGQMLGLNTVRNYGVSSSAISGQSTSTVDSFLARYAAMDDDADLIVVFGGTNDFGFNTPLGTIVDTTDISFYGALHVLMQGLINKYLGKRIIFMTPLHRDTENTANSVGKKLIDYVNAIKEVASIYAIPVIDTHNISGITPAIPAMKTAYINDGLHINVAGHKLLAGNTVGQFALY